MKKRKVKFKRIISVFTALTLCLTVPVYAAEADYDALDGTSPDKPETYSEIGYFEGYNSSGGYELMKLYADDYFKDYVHMLYLPNYDEYNEGLTFIAACPRSKTFGGGTFDVYHYRDCVVCDKVTLSDSADDGKVVVYDVTTSTAGINPMYGMTLYTKANNFIDSREPFSLDTATVSQGDWSQISFSDVISFDSSSTFNKTLLWSKSLTFNRKNKNLRVYDGDYICLWDSKVIGNYTLQNSNSFSSDVYNTSDVLSSLDYTQEPLLAKSIFVSLLSDGSINQCSDEQLAKLGVYRADKYDYDSDTGTCILKSGAVVRYDMPVPSGVEVKVDENTGLYEVLWNNSSVYAMYPDCKLNLVCLYSGIVTFYEKDLLGDIGVLMEMGHSYEPINKKIITRNLSASDGVSYFSSANIVNALLNYYNYSVYDYRAIAEPIEIHFLLRNYSFSSGSNVYHYSNWVDVKVVVTSVEDGVTDYDITIREISPAATSDDIIQALRGGNTGTNGDVGNSSNVTGGTGDVEYDGDSSHVTVQDSKTNLLSFVKSGFGLAGNNGAFALFKDIFEFLPPGIWTLLGSFVSIGIIIALVKLVF